MSKQDQVSNKTDSLGIKLLNRINLPNSLLIIPDGNGRWAKQMGLDIEKGHQAGGNTMSRLLEVFIELNIKIVGVWGFSEDNWKRDKTEIDNIMKVVRDTTEDSLAKMKKYGIKFIVLGSKDRIKKEYPNVYEVLENAEVLTAGNTNKTFAVFLDYGEKFQLEEFAKKREEDKTSETYFLLSKINKDLPLFDMILRTSGEQRVSGFGPLAALAEYVTVKKNLPDLQINDIVFALKEYASRQRRFGGR